MMDARTYLDTHKDAGAQAIVEAARRAGVETTVGYFKQIAYGHRRPSLELAEALAAASRAVALERGIADELGVMELLKAREIHSTRPNTRASRRREDASGDCAP